ncbi:MAG: TonB-dependent receptor domain-containing protein [Terriglobia bacterium]
MKRGCFLSLFLSILLTAVTVVPAAGQTITATLEGKVMDPAEAIVPGASVTATNTQTGLSRTVTTDELGEYRIPLLPVGEYEVSVEVTGFQRQVKKITLRIAQTARLDFTLQIGERAEQVVVEARGALQEPTRTTVASVIEERKIQSLPVSGRQFIDFTLLAPGVNIGETTSGSTDVIVEPVTKLAFGGQNIHFNFVAIDGLDNISTASGIQKTTPSQDAAREFQVINSTYSTEYGRAVGGIVNIVTKGGTNELHGTVYEFFQNDALQAKSTLEQPGLRKFQQNQFGFSLGGPIVENQTFFFINYEGQRRRLSPFYNNALLANIGPDTVNPAICPALEAAGQVDTINEAKVCRFGLPAENLNVTRVENMDNFLIRLDHQLGERHLLMGRYFFNDGRFKNQSPLNDGFDAPSTFRDNLFRDQSFVANLTSTFSPTFVNEFRGQFARRTFDFPAVSAEPHLEIANLFTTGVNRGNPDFYRESRFELVDSASWIRGSHTVSFGGNFNFVRTRESFPLFSPFEATFASVADYINGNPFVIFFETFPAGTTQLIGETGLDPSIFLLSGFPQDVREQASTEVDHTYNGFFLMDKWRATPRLTLNYGIRYEWETWPSRWLDQDLNNWDPRVGIAYNVGTPANLVIRAGFGLFHGIIPSPLIMCQEPSCGGSRQFPGREGIQNDLDARTGLFAFAGFFPAANQAAFFNLLSTGNFPTDPTCPLCAFGVVTESVIVRFVKDHQNPYAIQTSLGFEIEPVPDLIINASYLRVKGIHLGSFFNINQGPQTGVLPNGKADFCALRLSFTPTGCVIPGFQDFSFNVFFEATDRWRSVYDGLLINAERRFGRFFGVDLSYTWSKTIDDGPNPSFVLIPEDSQRLNLERAVSSDHVGQRFVLNTLVATPTDSDPFTRNWEFSSIITIRSPHFFTKFAGFDANGDVFALNDRVEGRNTFKGDSFRSVDVRVARSFDFNENVRLQLMGEVFNLFNTLNIRFFNTVCGAFVQQDPSTPGLRQGCPNPAFDTPRAIFDPRKFQLAVRLSF